MSIQNRFIQIRKELQSNSTEFAKKSEKNPVLIYGIETGKHKAIAPELLVKLHERFNLNLNDLIVEWGASFD